MLGALAEAAGAVAPVLVRVTTGVHAGGHEYIATSHEDQKFGLSLATGAALDALRAVHASPHLELRGIHTHIGSQILSIDSFKESAERMLRLRAEFAAESGYEMPEVDLGGGYAIAYTPESEEMDVEKASLEIADVVAQGVDAAGGGWPHISIEPGRAIAGPAGMTLYTVGVTKNVSLEEGGPAPVRGGRRRDERQHAHHHVWRRVHGGDRVAGLVLGARVLSRVVGKHCESGDIVVRDVRPAPGHRARRPARGARDGRLRARDGEQLQLGAAARGGGRARRRSRAC